MARMIPSTPPSADRPGGRAERLLYDALSQQLDDTWVVFHSYHVLDDERPHVEEADFLAVHPDHGLLVIECKGKGVVCNIHGEWHRVLGNGSREALRRTPFMQAADQMYTLVKRVREPFSRRISNLEKRDRFPMVCGYAVVFPLGRVERDRLPPSIHEDIVFDVDDLGRIGEGVKEALAFWRRNPALESRRLCTRKFRTSPPMSTTRQRQ